MTSMPGGDSKFHNALVGELKQILQIMPIDPGFKYADVDNAISVPENYVAGTKGTIFIGVPLVNKLLKQDDGGISVAGVLAHECAHIFQFFSPYNDRLFKGPEPTSVRFELHADVLAGYYLGRKKVSKGERLTGVQQALYKMGTYDMESETYHGTPARRVVALEKGFEFARDGLTFEQAADAAETFVRFLTRSSFFGPN